MNPNMKPLNPPAMVLLMLFCSVNVLGKSLIDSVVDPIVEEIVYIGSGQCETVKKLERAAYDQFKERPDLSNLSLVQITPEVTTTYNLTSLSKLPSSDSFKPGRPVIIFLHGYTKSPTAPPSVRVREAFQNEDVNFYLLNASQYIGCCNYPRATTMARFVGEALGEALVDLIQADVDAAMIHLIGHSLGAHMAGIAGSTVISTINKQVGRITGLDPALPCFDGAPAEIRLSEDDAAYVDALHTDSGVLGSNMNLGHADYWPNDGDRSSQPGCDDDSCAHASVCNLFAITVANQTRFPAYSCSDWKEFSNGNCDNNEISNLHTTYFGSVACGKVNEAFYIYADSLQVSSGVVYYEDLVSTRTNFRHADYWPNDGDRSSQPGCDDDSCAHASVCNLFAITVANQTRFPAYSCSDWKEFSNGNCDNNEISYMGYGSKPGTTGTFYLKTDDSTAPPENLADK